MEKERAEVGIAHHAFLCHRLSVIGHLSIVHGSWFMVPISYFLFQGQFSTVYRLLKIDRRPQKVVIGHRSRVHNQLSIMNIISN
jgi:hypothetical protein